MQQEFPAESNQRQSTIPQPKQFRWSHLIYGRPYRFTSRQTLEQNLHLLKQLITSAPTKQSWVHSTISYRGFVQQVNQTQGFARVSRHTKSFTGKGGTSGSANIWVETVDGVVQVVIEAHVPIHRKIAFLIPLIITVLMIPFLLPTPEKIPFLIALWFSIALVLSVMFQTGHLKRNLRILLGDDSLSS